jgi:pyridoxamine 5'-phosphate oxidase
MVKKNLAGLRQEYAASALNEKAMHAHPFEQFSNWFDLAAESGIAEPNAMTLATVDSHGMPHARVVLLKALDETGFVFYTNYHSEKAKQLAQNPQASILFFWIELQRQVRISGTVKKVTASESDEYFNIRPRASQLGALASPQSQVIPGREHLEQRFSLLEKQYSEKPITRPKNWGGYRLTPIRIEFWQGRANRLHDRLVYEKSGTHWVKKRLAP